MLRLLAILPPEPISGIVRREQERIATVHGPQHALKTPPHITLIPPVKADMKQAYLLEEICLMVTEKIAPFPIRLHGYGAFQKNVVFVRIEQNERLELLQFQLQKEIELILPDLLKGYPDRRFTPHMTIAHKDIKGETFNTVWDELSQRRIDLSFPAKMVTLLDHDGKKWTPLKNFPLFKSIV